MITWLTLSQNFCRAVMNNPELPLDPNLQTSNLLITFLKYASIVMQDTKGEHRLSLLFVYKSLFFFSTFPFHLKCPFVSLFLVCNISGKYFYPFSTAVFLGKPLPKTPLTLCYLSFSRWASSQQCQTVPDHSNLHSRGGAQSYSCHICPQHRFRLFFFLKLIASSCIYRISMLMPSYTMTTWTLESVSTEWWVCEKGKVSAHITGNISVDNNCIYSRKCNTAFGGVFFKYTF